ncbi:MAG: stage II sporulation protein R, partial [Corallococcus sp.]|nr:stage II sporulation protein R [Corallococcus sp.]
GNLTLQSGVYDALILNLGSGKGGNWWCVVYPPLCFVGGEGNGTSNVYYRSKIYEIIQNWRTSRK